jgi:hypothetical protein
MTEKKPEQLEDEHERKFRRIFAWVFFLGTSVVCIIVLYFAVQAAFFSHYMPYHGASPQLAEFLRQHFPVTIGLPVAAVISLLLILVLRETTGKLEFEALGFKFRGASGPLVLWVLCYLAIELSIKLLWK